MTPASAVVVPEVSGARPGATPADGQDSPLRAAARRGARPETTRSSGVKGRLEQLTLAIIIGLPVVAIALVTSGVFGYGLGWRDALIGLVAYLITGHGITVGYHRLFTHRSFKAARPLRIALAIAGSMAVQGPVARWVADHRRHHAHSDAAGDPHSPWVYGGGVYGGGPVNTLRGLWHAHVGWLFDLEQTNQRRFAPDLLDDRDLVWISRLFALWVTLSLGLPALFGWMLSGFTFAGAMSAFIWAGLVRVFLLHHVTWSINSICHTFGKRPFVTSDRSTNVWWLAPLSMGESWHNLHHAIPTSARHGVDRHQLDSSARIIRVFEHFGWARDVRWVDPVKLDRKRRGAVAPDRAAA